MQANMFQLLLKSREGIPRTFIVKRVVPRELPEKPSPEIWRTFVASVRKEIDFYKELQEPSEAPVRALFPCVYHSCGTDPKLDSQPMDTEFSIVMQDLSTDYIQKPMMDEKEARCVLESLACL